MHVALRAGEALGGGVDVYVFMEGSRVPWSVALPGPIPCLQSTQPPCSTHCPAARLSLPALSHTVGTTTTTTTHLQCVQVVGDCL